MLNIETYENCLQLIIHDSSFIIHRSIILLEFLQVAGLNLVTLTLLVQQLVSYLATLIPLFRQLAL